jgi:16S rRNA (cytidine1402-2'-O)-methyltransferase
MTVLGKLYLIPTTLGAESPVYVIPGYVKKLVSGLRFFIVEEERTARRFLRKLDPEFPIDDTTFYILNEHSLKEDISEYLNITDSDNVGILSEAGAPCVADPGSAIVKLAHQRGINVIPLIGPSSILLALMASGLNGQNFAFNGYLPVQKDQRCKQIKKLENHSFSEKQTQIFIEAPYRNQHLLEDILTSCEPATLLCIAADLTLSTEFIKTYSIAEWKKHMPSIQKRPSIFLIQKL